MHGLNIGMMLRKASIILTVLLMKHHGRNQMVM